MLNTNERQLVFMSTAAPAIEHDEIAVLRLLALEGALEGQAKVSCSGLADELDVSTQTASRRLQRLDDSDMIERDHVPDGQWIGISDDGRRLLRSEYETYRRIFDGVDSIELRGRITAGMGEGRHYIPLEGYRVQFVERLGYEPYPGTLNIILDEKSVRKRGRIEAVSPIVIEGWEDDERTYGPADCYPVEVLNEAGQRYTDAHVIVPKRTHHDEENLELIAPDRLREVLELDDGDAIDIELTGAPE